MDLITSSPDDLEDAPASAADPAVMDSQAEAAPTDAVAEADTPAPALLVGATSQPADPPTPSLSATQGDRLVPDAMAALHPKGGYIAMRLLSRMMTDLAVLTGDKRPATYDEVEEYLGHALVAEGIAPRGYTAKQAGDWWSMGGSARLHVSATGVRDDGSVIVSNGAVEANPAVSFAPSEGNPETPHHGYSGSGSPDLPYSANSAEQNSAAEIAAGENPAPSWKAEIAPDTYLGMRDEADPAPEARSTDPTGAAPAPADLHAKPSADPKAALAEARKQAVLAVNAATTTAKTSKAAPIGTDLSSFDKGFGDPAHGFHGDYRTTPQMRDWLREPKPLKGQDLPYPDGPSGSGSWSVEGGRKVRAEVAYFYTLPEVKAFLDLIAQLEAPNSDLGYYLSHGNRPPKLTDLDTFHGGISASGRYQIKADAWKKIGGALWSRSDFSPITQDLIAITLLRNRGAIDELLKGNLSAALTLAAPEFASIPVSLAVDHSYYTIPNNKRDANRALVRGSDGKPVKEEHLQSNPTPFRELPAQFAKHLAWRRAEFSQAEHAWETDRTLPQAFIPPTRWQAFGLPGFDRPKQTN